MNNVKFSYLQGQRVCRRFRSMKRDRSISILFEVEVQASIYIVICNLELQFQIISSQNHPVAGWAKSEFYKFIESQSQEQRAT